MRRRAGRITGGASAMTDIMAGIRGATWAPPFVYVDRIMHMDRRSAAALTVFDEGRERFSYGSFVSPSLLIECMAQLSLALIRHSDPEVEIGVIPSLRDIEMRPPPRPPFEAVIRVVWDEGEFPRYGFSGAALVNEASICRARLDILATRRAP